MTQNFWIIIDFKFRYQSRLLSGRSNYILIGRLFNIVSFCLVWTAVRSLNSDWNSGRILGTISLRKIRNSNFNLLALIDCLNHPANFSLSPRARASFRLFEEILLQLYASNASFERTFELLPVAFTVKQSADDHKNVSGSKKQILYKFIKCARMILTFQVLKQKQFSNLIGRKTPLNLLICFYSLQLEALALLIPPGLLMKVPHKIWMFPWVLPQINRIGA